MKRSLLLPRGYTARDVSAPPFTRVIHWATTFDTIAELSPEISEWWGELATMSHRIEELADETIVLPTEVRPWLEHCGGSYFGWRLFRDRAHVWTCKSFSEAIAERLSLELGADADGRREWAKALRHVVELRDRGLLRHIERLLDEQR